MKKKSFTLDSYISRSDEIVASMLDDEVVMMSIEQDAYYGLDPIGSRIWEIIEKPARISEICDVLMEEYDVSRETCEKDVLNFFDKLAKDKLVKAS